MTRITPLILAVALFMENMDATVIATSLPAIAADLNTDPVALKLALTSYLVSLAIFIPISGWVADKYGARGVFRTAIGVFVIGSVACAFAWSLESFVVARFIQGMGGAMMTPLARLVLVRTTDRSELVSAMAWLTIPALVAPTVGPPLGGFLTTFLSWHWIFLINVPIGLAGILLTGKYLPVTPRLKTPPLDWPGFILVAIAFAGLVFGLSVVSLPALPPISGVAMALAGLGAGLGYLWHASRAAHPLLDLSLFRVRTFRVAIFGSSLFIIGVGAIPFLFPLMLQVGFGLSPFEAGLITFIGALGALAAKFFAKALFARFGFRATLTVAAVLSAALIAVKGTFVPATPIFVMMGVLVVAGMIRSSFFTGVNAFSFADISDRQAGQATAIASVTRPVSTALGVAVAGAVLELTRALGGGRELEIGDFQLAFFVVATISLTAAIPFMLLPKGAGSNVSGHHLSVEPTRDSGQTPEAPRRLKDALDTEKRDPGAGS